MPAATAQVLTARPMRSLVLSVVIGVVVTWFGLGVAFYLPYPIGFFVTTFAFGLYVLANAIKLGVPKLRTSWSTA
jgi:zinc/manganese transport system permease protein